MGQLRPGATGRRPHRGRRARPLRDRPRYRALLGRTGLAVIDPQQARIVELRFFAGMTIDETAHVLDRSPRTIKREWRLAKAWLFRELQMPPAA